MGAKYTKGQVAATEKYMRDKHTIRVVVQKEKADKYKTEAAAAGKSLSKFIVDCVDNQSAGKSIYTHELAELLGDAYNDVLKVMDQKGHDPYDTMSERFPLKCLIMLLPRAMVLGVPKELDKKIENLMNMLNLEDISKMINAPMPMEYVIDFNKGMLKCK